MAKPGRRKLPDELRRVGFTLSLPAALLGQIDAHAKFNRRSRGREIEARLAGSLSQDEIIQRIRRAIGEAIDISKGRNP